MTKDILDYFAIQRQIFGICPRSGEFFRLSDCRVYMKTKPKKDWMDRLEAQCTKLDQIEEKLEENVEHLREIARREGCRLARSAVRKIDTVFAQRRLNPDDAKVIFHPIDYVVFNGMKGQDFIKGILLLDSFAKDSGRRHLQRSIEKVVEKGHYEWVTVRALMDGSVQEDA
ncbi:MAG: Holliday junction resolvase-like protein [Terriglobia bacterium]